MIKKFKRFYILRYYHFQKWLYIRKQRFAVFKERLQAYLRTAGDELERQRISPVQRLLANVQRWRTFALATFRKNLERRLTHRYINRFADALYQRGQKIRQTLLQDWDAFKAGVKRAMSLVSAVFYALRQAVAAGFKKVAEDVASDYRTVKGAAQKAENALRAAIGRRAGRWHSAVVRHKIQAVQWSEGQLARYQSHQNERKAKREARRDAYFQRDVGYAMWGSAAISLVFLFVMVLGLSTGAWNPIGSFKAVEASAHQQQANAGTDKWSAFVQNLIEPAAGEPKNSGVEITKTSKNDPEIDWESYAGDLATDLEVQAILVAKGKAVISGTMDGHVVELPFKSGETFRQGDVLVKYDCGIEDAQLEEATARMRLEKARMKAAKELFDLDTVSEIERVSAIESFHQAEALVKQLSERVKLCAIKAPFDGRVANSLASLNEFVQRGRVIMEVTEREQLNAEFLIPSVWLRWLNVGTELNLFVQESGKSYGAKIKRIHGEVDPVSRSVQVVAEIDSYREELLPGMSGRATFDPQAAMRGMSSGFLGLNVQKEPATDSNEN